MNIAITGLSNSGKTTVFNALTGMQVETTVYPTTSGEPNVGVVKVPDARIDKLISIFNPKKTAHSTVKYVDYIGLTKGDLKQNKQVFEFVKDADALVLVLRGFESDEVVHPLDRIDPASDASTVETELIFGDLELVERRLEGIELSKRKGKKPASMDEEKVLTKCREALESEKPLRQLELSADELRAIRHLQFVSIKPLIVAINISESALGSAEAEAMVQKVRAVYPEGSGVSVLTLCGKVEMEIAELPADEAAEFLKDLGIAEPALNRLIRQSYEDVGLISFFTVGEDEVKAWAIRRNTDALNAAGKIHSDIQRGFIRAEVISYDDFVAMGSLSAARDKGLLRLEGKTYIVADGDIINFRFNV